MNLKEMREEQFTNKFLTLLNKYHFDCIAPAQDYLNAMCNGKILYLDENWDAMPTDGKQPLPNPKLIHYNLFQKPWCYDNIQYEDYFWKYAKQTSYYEQIVEFKNNYSDKQKQSDKDVEFENPNYTPDYLYEVGASGKDSAMLNGNSMAKGELSTAIGRNTLAEGIRSFASGTKTAATGDNSHAEGLQTLASGVSGSHAEGYQTKATGDYSHSEGRLSSATADGAHAEGYNTTAKASYAHAEGNITEAAGAYSHSEGQNTHATGYASHTQGAVTYAQKTCSFAGGQNTTSDANFASAIGLGLYTSVESAFIVGKYNYNTAGILFGVGNGTADNARSNALEVYEDGHAEVKLMGSTDKSIATKQYIDNALNSKADKIGLLPHFNILNTNTNVLDFITTNNVAGRTIILHIEGNEDDIIGIFVPVGSKYAFRLTWVSSNVIFESHVPIDLTNITWIDIIDIGHSPYKEELEIINNKVTTLSSDSTDTEYPSAKCVYDGLETKADKADYYTKTESDNKYVPYTGGTADINLHGHTMEAYHLWANGAGGAGGITLRNMSANAI